MEHQEIAEIIACLPRGKTLFHYFPNRYAFYLLGLATGAGAPIREIKRTTAGVS